MSEYSPFDVSTELEAALEVADAADAFTLPRFVERDFSIDWKANRTEVTEIDRAAESLIVDRLGAAFPSHGVFGEEHGHGGDPAHSHQWVVDPIDGTSGFVRGIPVWATLIGLVVAGQPALGVVSAPALGLRWWGGIELGARVRSQTTGERELRVSSVAAIPDAQVCVTHSSGWDELGLTGRLVELQQRARRSRGMGDFWQHMLVAEGAMDVAVDAIGVAPHDLAAIQPIVEAAGGRFTDRHGRVTHEHDSAISSNGRLHDQVLALLDGRLAGDPADQLP